MITYQALPTHNVPETWVLVLNRYQRDNLLYLLNACGYPYMNPHRRGDFAVANTGDWLGEIAMMLAKRVTAYDNHEANTVIDEDDHPNLWTGDAERGR